MNKTVHTIAGVVPFMLLTAGMPSGFEILGSTVYPMVACATSVIASPLPDLDLKPLHYSRGKKGVSKKVAQVKSKAVNKVTGGHRGITHTMLFPALFLGVYVAACNVLVDYPSLRNFVGSLIFGMFSGWTLHIFADMFNGKGCPLLWPFVRNKIPGIDLPSEGIVPYLWLVAYTYVLYIIIL